MPEGGTGDRVVTESHHGPCVVHGTPQSLNLGSEVDRGGTKDPDDPLRHGGEGVDGLKTTEKGQESHRPLEPVVFPFIVRPPESTEGPRRQVQSGTGPDNPTLLGSSWTSESGRVVSERADTKALSRGLGLTRRRGDAVLLSVSRRDG